MLNYIPHPSNARLAGGLLRLRIDEGAAGYGIYWMILELLRDAPDYKLTADPRALAFAINETDVDQVQRVINNLALFDHDTDGNLYSPWLNEQLSAYDDKKRKLQEAGRRGAARRYQSKSIDNGVAIATPSGDDGVAIATHYNITQHDVTENTTPSESPEDDWRVVCQSQGLKVDDDLVSAIAQTQPEGHAPGYVAQICHQWGMGQNVLDYLLRITDNAALTNTRYKAFCGLVAKITREKYSPKYPANFFCSKLQNL
ncbi:MAG: DUF4373 domain-containing protein [Bacteroidaceae bacterium]|nr:DUF4373 domain-containing protein [Bacteroidaceae bacterium]